MKTLLEKKFQFYFRDDITERFSQLPSFCNKSSWNPPNRNFPLEMFLGQLEGDIFSVLPGKSASYYLTKKKWFTMRRSAKDRIIIIKPADKGSYVAVWDRPDHLIVGISQGLYI